MADAPVKNNIFNGPAFTALAVKAIPAASTVLVGYGVITKDQANTLVQGAPDFLNVASVLLGIAGYGFTIVWNFWKNRKTKRAADAAAIPGVSVSAAPALAAAISAVAVPAAQNSIASK